MVVNVDKSDREIKINLMEFGSETSFRAKMSLHNEKPMCPRNYAWKTLHQLFFYLLAIEFYNKLGHEN